MNNHANIFGASGMGKTWAICWLAALSDSIVILLDPQHKGAGEELANVYKKLGIPYQHEIVGGERVLPMDFLPKSSGTEFEFWCEALTESITAHRNQSDGYAQPLTQEHLNMFYQVMNETGKTVVELDPAWFYGDVILKEIKDPKAFAWAAECPNPNSMAGRDRLPAKRKISILKCHEMARKFLKEFTVPQLLNEIRTLIVSAGPYTTTETMSFYINYLILAIVNAKKHGKIKGDITIIYEESELAGVSTMIGKFVNEARKYGIGLWFVSQSSEWRSDPSFNITKAIWNGCDTTIAFRSKDADLLERIANTFPVYAPNMPKFIKSTPRSILTGFKEFETESKTRGKYDSVTEGIRHQGVYRFFQDININFMSVGEQKELFKKAITKLKVGQALVKCGDQISIKQFPPLGRLLEKKSKSGFASIHPQSPKYFREGIAKAVNRPSDTSKPSTRRSGPRGLL